MDNQAEQPREGDPWMDGFQEALRRVRGIGSQHHLLAALVDPLVSVVEHTAHHRGSTEAKE